MTNYIANVYGNKLYYIKAYGTGTNNITLYSVSIKTGKVTAISRCQKIDVLSTKSRYILVLKGSGKRLTAQIIDCKNNKVIGSAAIKKPASPEYSVDVTITGKYFYIDIDCYSDGSRYIYRGPVNRLKSMTQIASFDENLNGLWETDKYIYYAERSGKSTKYYRINANNKSVKKITKAVCNKGISASSKIYDNSFKW